MSEPNAPEAADAADAPETPETPEDVRAAVALPAPPDDPAVWIDRPGQLVTFCEHLATCDEIAIDTEANSMHAYREQTCIVQVTAGGRNAIIDPLALADLIPLGEAIDRPEVEVVLHGGDYDISCLTRDHDFRFHRVFDTMIAATLLGVERVGLASLVDAHFDVQLEKRYQRADWARRPVSDEQLDYLRRDTLYLPTIRAHLMERLVEADLVEEAEIEFLRLTKRVGKPFEMKPDAWRRIKGSAKLDDVGRCVLRSLHLWRESEAESRDRPPFKVFSPQRMMQLAAEPPRRAHHPRTLPFLSHGERSRYGRKIVAAIQQGIAAHGKGDIPPRHQTTALAPGEARSLKVVRAREDALRDWRRKELKARSAAEAAAQDLPPIPVPGVVVLPNPAIAWLATTYPTDLDELTACPDIGPKRVARYGDAILAVLTKTG